MINGYILSYNNPDTDSVCSSIAYSYYLKTYDKVYVPVICGNISPETSFVLKAANVDIPFENRELEPDKKIVLIDTHNISQIPHLTFPDNVIEIIDHHSDGDMSIFKNADITNRQIGAVASIIAEKCLNKNIMNKSLAILLGSAIISNTVNFTAPSTTNYDKIIFKKIEEYYAFNKDYAYEMFKYKNSILNKRNFEILTSDEKDYIIANHNVKIAQLELVNVCENICFEDFYCEMKNIIYHGNIDVYIVSFIDVVNLKTFILVADEYSSELVQLILNQTSSRKLYEFDRVLLRKTDIVPKLYDAINKITQRMGD